FGKGDVKRPPPAARALPQELQRQRGLASAGTSFVEVEPVRIQAAAEYVVEPGIAGGNAGTATAAGAVLHECCLAAPRAESVMGATMPDRCEGHAVAAARPPQPGGRVPRRRHPAPPATDPGTALLRSAISPRSWPRAAAAGPPPRPGVPPAPAPGRRAAAPGSATT